MARRVLPPRIWQKQVSAIADGPMCEVRTLSPAERQRFLTMVAAGASMHAASAAIPVPFLVIGRLLVADEQFAADLEAAKRLRTMALEETLIDQATVGVDEPVVYQGAITASHKKLVTSNPTLLAILKANDPGRWKERSEVTHKGEVEEVPDRITNASDRDKILAALAKRAAERAGERAGEPNGENEDLL